MKSFAQFQGQVVVIIVGAFIIWRFNKPESIIIDVLHFSNLLLPDQFSKLDSFVVILRGMRQSFVENKHTE